MTELIAADLFCGGGGASEGLVQACREMGIELKLYAVNHWKQAVKVHKKNHPNAIHRCAEVGAINPRTFVQEGYLDFLIAAPECIFHSQARGGKPIDDQRRSTAWGVVDWAEAMNPPYILIENVPEFKKWGPLHHCPHNRTVRRKIDGKFRKVPYCPKHKKCLHNKPVKEQAGSIYQNYLSAFKALGYTVEERILCAADYGAATTRKRLFIICKKVDGQVPWPIATHGQDAKGQLKKWRAAREVIDWTLKGQSIFDRKRPLAPATMRRILAGLERYGGEDLQPYLCILRNHMDGKSIDGPMPTIAAAGQHIGIAHPVIVVANNNNNVPRPVDQPVATVTGGNRLGVADAVILPTTHGSDKSRRERSVGDPLPTITGANRGEGIFACCQQMNSGGWAFFRGDHQWQGSFTKLRTP